MNTIGQADWEHSQEHGYIIVRDLFTPQGGREMLAECDAIHRGDSGELYGGAFQVEPEFAEEARKDPSIAKLARKIIYVVGRAARIEQGVGCPLKPGSSLVFHSRLLHGSEPNRSDTSRRAFVTSSMSAKYKQIKESGRTRYFLVCGRTYPGCVRTNGDQDQVGSMEFRRRCATKRNAATLDVFNLGDLRTGCVLSPRLRLSVAPFLRQAKAWIPNASKATRSTDMTRTAPGSDLN